jgi:uncharacterized protein (PEP-CTERM system associated)
MIPTEADIMDTIMPSVKFKNINTKCRLHGTSYLALSIASLLAPYAFADIDITGTVQGESIFQEVDSEDDGTLSLTTFSISPKLNTSLETRTFSGFWSGTITHLERDKRDDSRNDTFGEYDYSARWAPFERFILFDASGALTYQNTDSSNYLVSDFLSNADSLSKTRSNRIATSVFSDQGNWAQGFGTVSYSNVKSERSELDLGNALNNNILQFEGTFENGDQAKQFIWEVSGTYQDSDRDESVGGDYSARTVDAFIDTSFAKNWAIRLTGSHEANQISDRTDTTSSTREFNSYGAGLTYRQNANRYISVTANKSDSDVSDDDSNTYVGLDIEWALSNRTSVKGSYGRRFYGESASADITYNSKYFRTALSYSEDVTTTSQLLADFENLGVFVCPTNSTSISGCFQPNSLDYTTSADEQFVQLTTQNLSFDDNIILLKSTNFQAGYSFSRLTLAFSWRYDESDYLDEDRLRRTYALGTTVAYQLGNYTYLNTSVDYANVDERSNSDGINTGSTDNWNASLGLERNIGRSLTTNIDITYLEKNGDLAIGGGQFGENYTDRRITLSIIYTYQ